MRQLIIIMEDSKTLFWSTKFTWGHQTISSKFRGNLGTSPRNGTPALDWTNELRMESHRRAGSTLRTREVPVQISPRRPNIPKLYMVVLGISTQIAGQYSACVFSGSVSDVISAGTFTSSQLG